MRSADFAPEEIRAALEARFARRIHSIEPWYRVFARDTFDEWIKAQAKDASPTMNSSDFNYCFYGTLTVSPTRGSSAGGQYEDRNDYGNGPGVISLVWQETRTGQFFNVVVTGRYKNADWSETYTIFSGWLIRFAL